MPAGSGGVAHFPAMDATTAVANAYAWFEHHSGWAPPEEGTLAEWVADGVCRCPDECLVSPDGWCEHGLASWALILAAQAHLDALGSTGRPGR